MSKDAIIHAWEDKRRPSLGGSSLKAAKNGYQTVLSNGFYIDLMLGSRALYEWSNSQKSNHSEEKARILGERQQCGANLLRHWTLIQEYGPEQQQ
jgi:hexosaminidase